MRGEARGAPCLFACEQTNDEILLKSSIALVVDNAYSRHVAATSIRYADASAHSQRFGSLFLIMFNGLLARSLSNCGWRIKSTQTYSSMKYVLQTMLPSDIMSLILAAMLQCN